MFNDNVHFINSFWPLFKIKKKFLKLIRLVYSVSFRYPCSLCSGFSFSAMNSVFSNSPTLPPDKPKPSSISNHGDLPSRSSPGLFPTLPPGKPKLDQAIMLTNNSFHDLTPEMPEKTMKPEQSQSLPNQITEAENSVSKPLNSPVGSGYSLPAPPPRPVSRNKGVIPQVSLAENCIKG